MTEAQTRNQNPLIGIVDYGVGNIHSVANATDVVGGQTKLIANPDEVTACDAIILPGVGAFEPAIRALHDSGMIPALSAHVKSEKPLLGICLGMQLLCRRSFENGENSGLGWIAADVHLLPAEAGLKIPHMGWNTLEMVRPHPLLDGLPAHSDAYFLHSFFVKCDDNADMVAVCRYGADFPAIVASGSIYGMQFHPEKSQDTGLLLLRNFVRGIVQQRP